MPTSALPSQLVIGDTRNGVAEYADDLAQAVRRRSPATEILRFESPAQALSALGSARRRLHLHVTDALFGSDLRRAADAVCRLTTQHAVSLTLHDLPQESDGAENRLRRAAAYARFVEHAVGVAVSSEHEALLLRESVATSLRPAVLPLGTRRARPNPSEGHEIAGSSRLDLLMAGYVYPGKGHDDVLAAAAVLAARIDRPIRLTVLGGVSDGHDDEWARLAGTAAAGGVELVLTGYLDRSDYAARLAGPGIPVIAHRHYSASRSLLDWAEAGRRALVVSTRYTAEMAALRPGTLHLVGGDTESLADSIELLCREPARTRLEPDTALSPTLDDVADAACRWWETLAW